VEAIVGDRVAAGLADHYLARAGYDSQQTEEPENPERPHNLWLPVDDLRDFGAHGRFDGVARSSSREFVISKHRRAFAAAAAVVLTAGVVDHVMHRVVTSI